MRPADALLGHVREINAAGRAALCGYFLAGYPNPYTFYRVVRAADAADVIEYGVLADDPTLDGALVPDIGPEEARFVATGARSLGLADARAPRAELEQVALGSDVVYLKVAGGPTGEVLELASQQQTVEKALGLLRAAQPGLLVAAGIGVQTPEHVAALAGLGVDMIVVGTKVLEHTTLGPDNPSRYLGSLREATWRGA